MKTCKRCGVEQRLDSYHRNKSYADGRRSVCSACVSRQGRLERLDRRLEKGVLPYDQVCDLHLAGWSMGRIAKRYQIEGRRVRHILERNGVPVRTRSFGPRHHRWQGGRFLDPNGYVTICLEETDPFRGVVDHGGRVFEHRYLMMKRLGRALRDGETVHHINGIRDDNRIENLQLRHGAHGEGVVLRCADCGSCNVMSEEL